MRAARSKAARRAGVPFGEAWPAVLDAMEDDQWREKGLMPYRPRRRSSGSATRCGMRQAVCGSRQTRPRANAKLAQRVLPLT
jgi:hypothetical protein